MPVGDILELIDSSIKQIASIEPDKQTTAVTDLVQVRQWLDDSQAKCSPEELVRHTDLSRRYKKLADPLAADLRAFCDTQLTKYEGIKQPSDIGRFEQEITQIRRSLELAAKLLPDAPSQEEFQALQARLNPLLGKLRSIKSLTTLKSETNDLWESVVRVEEANPARAIDLCKQALDKLKAALQIGDLERVETDEAIILRDQFQRRYDDLRNRHEIPTTKQKGEELVPLILYLAELAGRTPPVKVTYFVSAEPGAQPQEMDVDKALDIARQRLISTVWRETIENYVRQADRYLNAHQPREAIAALLAWEFLPGLNDQRVGVALPDNHNLRIILRNAESRIKPELASLETAEKKANEARLELESDPAKAYKIWQDAQEAYTYLPGLDQLRKDIITKAGDKAVILLGESEEALQNELWGLCESRLKQIAALVNLGLSLKREDEGRLSHLREISDRVGPLVSSGGERPKPEEEQTNLERLQADYGDYWVKWKGLQTRLTELQARGDVKAFQQQVDEHCKADIPLDVIEVLSKRCVEMRSSPPAGISAQDKKLLDQLDRRLKAWVGFARAREELEKASNIAAPDTDAGGTGDVMLAPNLKIIKEGITAAKNDPAATQASRQKRLSDRLAQLESNDALAVQAIARIEHLLAPDSSQALQDSKDAVRETGLWLRRPTSYGVRFLELRRDAQSVLFRESERKIAELMSRAEKDLYASLDIVAINTLLKECASISLYSEERQSLTDLTQGPLAIANAHAFEEDAKQDILGWDRVKEAWDRAAGLLRTDDPRREFCLRRAKQALKQSVFRQVRHMQNTEDIERNLRSLCEDAILKDDWEVWLHHSDHCLRAAQTIMRALAPDQPIAVATGYLSKARESLGRASRIAADGGVPDNKKPGVQKALSDLDQWERLNNTRSEIQLMLQSSAVRLTADTCRDVHRKCAETLRTLRDEPKQLLQTFWAGQCAAARDRLERQIAQAQDVFEKLDALSAISVLFPNDDTAKSKLAGLVMDAIHRVQIEADDKVFDSTARKFLARYARANRGRTPDTQQVVQLQLDEAQQLIGKVHALKAVLSTLPAQDKISVSPNALAKEEDELGDWEGQLKDLQKTMDQALALAEDGLSAPQQFEAAKYILRQGGTASPAYLQVPATFKDQAHPSYRWCVSEVGKLERRRKDQENLLHRIQLCIKYEQICKPDELPLRASDPDEHSLVEELRQKLQYTVHRNYPIEEAFKMMQEMQRREPYDACGLQETMLYYDPEDNQRCHKPLVAICEVFKRKVAQVQTLRRWLSQFTIGTSPSTDQCPGIVDWDAERLKIVELRDSGPEGLAKAKVQCQIARCGNKSGLFQAEGRDLWPLEKARDALSRQNMLSQLTGVRVGDNEEPSVNLCAVAESIDKEREALLQRLNDKIADCSEIERGIDDRISEYPSKWETFLDAYTRLVNLRRNFANSREWPDFRQAAAEFCDICPNYGEFQKILDDVNTKTGLSFDCSGMVGTANSSKKRARR